MRKKMRPGYSRPANWRIDYEEGPVTDGWVYKRSGELIADGNWHSFSEDGQACYRITEQRRQFISAQPRIANAAWRTIVESFASIKPLLDDGVAELRMCAADGKFWVWSIWLPKEKAIRLAGLTRVALLVAMERVNEQAAKLRADSGD